MKFQKKKRRKGKKERKKERRGEGGEKISRGTDEKWEKLVEKSRFCRRGIKEGGNIAREYRFRLFALKSDKSPDKKLSYPKREFQSSLTLPVGEV